MRLDNPYHFRPLNPAGSNSFSAVRKRAGKILVLFALLLPVLLGMVGLVIDTGLMMTAHRQAKNAADAGSLAAAMELMLGGSDVTATAAAQTFVQQYNGLAKAPPPEINIPPRQGPHAGNPNYVEVIVSKQVNTWFIQVLGAEPSYTVRARAVAGFEPASGEGAIVLDPRAQPGLSVSGGGALRVDGSLVINSWSGGWDQYGSWVNWGYPGFAATTGIGSTVQARYLQVRGGVDVVRNYTNFHPGGPNPLFSRAKIVPDPLRDLPVPMPANVTSMSSWKRIPPVEVRSGQSRTFSPGVYADIQVDDGATAVFNPGVYILSPNSPNQGLRIRGAGTVTGRGVMFYITGSDYLDNGPGYYDGLDGPLDLDDSTRQLPPRTERRPRQPRLKDRDVGGRAPGQDQNPMDDEAGIERGKEKRNDDHKRDGDEVPAKQKKRKQSDGDEGDNETGHISKLVLASIDINATGTIQLTGLQDNTSPFNNLLFYQMRRNQNALSIQSGGHNISLDGIIYAKWANLKLAGGGSYNAQFVVGSMSISGQANVTIQKPARNFGTANQVFLVE